MPIVVGVYEDIALGIAEPSETEARPIGFRLIGLQDVEPAIDDVLADLISFGGFGGPVVAGSSLLDERTRR